MRLNKFIVSSILAGFLTMPVFAASSVFCPGEVKQAINKYKQGDYIGCIQDLQEYTENDPSNAIAYYYIGIAYMKVGLKDNAIDSLQKVSAINTVPKLSSYAIQATRCMQNNLSSCSYKNFSESQIEKLIKDPLGFFDALEGGNPEEQGEPAENGEDTDIIKLINGDYPSNIHPDANRTIQETRLIQEQERVNSELKKRMKPKKKSELNKETSEKIASVNPSDKEIADAVRTLSKAGYKFTAPSESKNTESKQKDKDFSRQQYQNMASQYALSDDMEQMAMLFGDNGKSCKNDDWAMLNFLMNQKNPDGTPAKMNPELVKTMMMSQMMGDYDFGMTDNKDK